jgi:hypothetical protein
VTRTGADLIDGASSKTLNTQYQANDFVSDTSNAAWMVM